jgi:hypothetical protein
MPAVSQTANYVERNLLLPSLYYCAENAGDEMVIMRSRNCVVRTAVMKHGSGSCPVVGCVISGFVHLV